MDKLLTFVKLNGNKAQLQKALEFQLPDGPVYKFLEGRLPHPSHTFTRLAELVEAEETEMINKKIGERRTRIGARKDQVTVEVKREIYGKSQLEGIYQNVIDWTNNDEARREYEEKLLQRAYDTLLVLGLDKKKEKRDQVVELAHGMVIIKHPFLLAWDIELEWFDAETFDEMEPSEWLREYIQFFPDKGLSSVLRGWLSSSLSPFPPLEAQSSTQMPDVSDDDDDNGGGVSLAGGASRMNAEDRLVLMNDGLTDAKNSVLAYRLVSDYYAYLEEDESTVETIRKGVQVLETESKKIGPEIFQFFRRHEQHARHCFDSVSIPEKSPRSQSSIRNRFCGESRHLLLLWSGLASSSKKKRITSKQLTTSAKRSKEIRRMSELAPNLLGARL